MNPNEVSILANQTGIAVLAVYGLEWLKKSKWFPWVTANTAKLNTIIGVVIAFATSVGVHYAVNGTAATGWHIVLDIPNVKVLLHAAAQFGGQQMLYHTAVQPAAIVGMAVAGVGVQPEQKIEVKA